MNKTVIATAAVGALLGIAGCSEDSSQTDEINRRQQSYDQLAAEQPAEQMEYSPTRETVNNWIETWGSDPEKLSYVYIQNANGDYGYFVLKGLPVSYCAMLTPTYEFIDKPGDGDSYDDYEVAAPGVDGAYYSGQQCGVYYGFDAETGAYVEFSVGQNQSFFLYDQPMDLPGELVQMGPTEID